MSSLYITYHKDISLPTDLDNLKSVPLGVFNDEICNEIRKRHPSFTRTNIVKVKITTLYIFIYINGDRLDCELP